MSDRLEWFTITVPASTPASARMTFPCVFAQGDVIEIDIKVPPGPQGNVGFYVAAGGSQYVPRTPGSYVMPDNDYLVWPIQHAINSGSWAVTAYNTDIWSHSIQVGFHVNDIGPGGKSDTSLLPSSSAAIPISALTSGSGNGTTVDPLSPEALIASLPSDTDLLAELTSNA